MKVVHAVEQSLGIARSDRAWRIACTVADQAIQGPGSTQFSAHECQVDGLPEDSLAVGVCKFHIVDGVGCRVDQRFAETHTHLRPHVAVGETVFWVGNWRRHLAQRGAKIFGHCVRFPAASSRVQQCSDQK